MEPVRLFRVTWQSNIGGPKTALQCGSSREADPDFRARRVRHHRLTEKQDLCGARDNAANSSASVNPWRCTAPRHPHVAPLPLAAVETSLCDRMRARFSGRLRTEAPYDEGAEVAIVVYVHAEKIAVQRLDDIFEMRAPFGPDLGHSLSIL